MYALNQFSLVARLNKWQVDGAKITECQMKYRNDLQNYIENIEHKIKIPALFHSIIQLQDRVYIFIYLFIIGLIYRPPVLTSQSGRQVRKSDA